MTAPRFWAVHEDHVAIGRRSAPFEDEAAAIAAAGSMNRQPSNAAVYWWSPREGKAPARTWCVVDGEVA